MKRVALLLVLLVCFPAGFTTAQTKPTAPTSSLCTRDNAVETTKQQILITRTFDAAAQRVAILIRAGDLLWPYEQDKALAAFLEAFDLALQHHKQFGDGVRRTSESQFAARYTLPDQRFKVITALARRDPERARKLSEQMLQDDAKEAADKQRQPGQSNGDKMLQTAMSLVETDPATAALFARTSFRYPAGLQLTVFMYALAKTNQAIADQFYNEALTAYGATPMDQFLYLSAYPFGNTRDAGEMTSYTSYRVPPAFAPNAALQRRFLQVLFTRIETALVEQAVEATPNSRYTDHAQMWFALIRLEKQIETNHPNLLDQAVRYKDRLFAVLNAPTQKRVTGVLDRENAPKKSFDEQVEEAEKLTDVGRREQGLAFAVTGASKDQTVERVLSVIDKISDSNVRGPLTNWFYYTRSQALMAEKNFSEARRLASKVEELDMRAYLFTRIAEESLKEGEDQTESRQMLNETSDAISKAPKTINSARALLALAYLYTKLDVNRGVEELGNAVKTINGLENPDFTLQYTMIKIEGKTFGFFTSYSTPGFNPEHAFREMGKVDFDGTLAQAAQFSDKSLRGLTTLSVIEPCFAVTTRKTKKS